MKTPIEELIAFAERFGKMTFSDHEKKYFAMKEKLEQQMAYNAGYSKAKQTSNLTKEYNTN